MTTECVGFADCPCLKCRQTRRNETAAHPVHELGNVPYCGVCRTATLQAYRPRNEISDRFYPR